MIANDVIEELPTNEAAQWISCSTIEPKPNGDIRMTHDARQAVSLSCNTIPIFELSDDLNNLLP